MAETVKAKNSGPKNYFYRFLV